MRIPFLRPSARRGILLAFLTALVLFALVLGQHALVTRQSRGSLLDGGNASLTGILSQEGGVVQTPDGGADALLEGDTGGGGGSGGDPAMQPNITGISPATAQHDQSFTLTVSGGGFRENSYVRVWPQTGVWNGGPGADPNAPGILETTYVSPTQLTAAVPANATNGATVEVRVITPAQGGGLYTSNMMELVIAGPGNTNPAPTISRLDPDAVDAGRTTPLSVSVYGTNVVASSIIRINGQDRPTTGPFTDGSGQQYLRVTLQPSELAMGAEKSVTVFNPAPGGGESSATTFVVINPAPEIHSISPDRVGVGSPTTAVMITGAGFLPGTIVEYWDKNMPMPGIGYTYLSPTQLTASIPVTWLQTLQSDSSIRVRNPSPGGGDSRHRFEVIAPFPFPTIHSVTPSGIGRGGPDLFVKIRATPSCRARYQKNIPGQYFLDGSAPLAGPLAGVSCGYISDDIAEDYLWIPAAYMEQAGMHTISLVIPSPGGGSTTVPFTVTDTPADVGNLVINLQVPPLSDTQQYIIGILAGPEEAVFDAWREIAFDANGFATITYRLHPGTYEINPQITGWSGSCTNGVPGAYDVRPRFTVPANGTTTCDITYE